jgi:hypothetical protein
MLAGGRRADAVGIRASAKIALDRIEALAPDLLRRRGPNELSDPRSAFPYTCGRGTGLGKGLVLLDDLIAAVAARNGFRQTDYWVEWDGGEFDPAHNSHRLVITTKDGRTATATLSEPARNSTWSSIGPIEDAFAELQRRTKPRGA